MLSPSWEIFYYFCTRQKKCAVVDSPPPALPDPLLPRGWNETALPLSSVSCLLSFKPAERMEQHCSMYRKNVSAQFTHFCQLDQRGLVAKLVGYHAIGLRFNSLLAHLEHFE